ncbi:hypothetical protein Prudu_001701 [Prunus dulcis]|uniref:Secreted protein n=1 Tax=Prunus dulcis TaxID=3755 RepID=A0A4Y1QP81_PRUDU|nr:hypothetical protein Prudu_001701 [Prunus dulcis]
MRTLVMMNPIGVFGLVSGELSVLGCHYHFKDCIAKSVVVDYPYCHANEHTQKRGPLAKKRKFGDLCIRYKSVSQ